MIAAGKVDTAIETHVSAQLGRLHRGRPRRQSQALAFWVSLFPSVPYWADEPSARSELSVRYGGSPLVGRDCSMSLFHPPGQT